MTNAERYAYYKARERCVNCHGQDAFTLAGRSYCADCIEKYRTYSKRWRDAGGNAKRKAKKEQKRAERKAAHCCTHCGVPLPGNSTFLTCDKCRAKFRNSDRKRTERRTGFATGEARLRWVYGLCWRCGRPVKSGESSSGEPYRVCEDCYEKNIRGLERAARAKREEGHPWTKENAIVFIGSARSSRLSES